MWEPIQPPCVNFNKLWKKCNNWVLTKYLRYNPNRLWYLIMIQVRSSRDLRWGLQFEMTNEITPPRRHLSSGCVFFVYTNYCITTTTRPSKYKIRSTNVTFVNWNSVKLNHYYSYSLLTWKAKVGKHVDWSISGKYYIVNIQLFSKADLVYNSKIPYLLLSSYNNACSSHIFLTNTFTF